MYQWKGNAVEYEEGYILKQLNKLLVRRSEGGGREERGKREGRKIRKWREGRDLRVNQSYVQADEQW